MRRRVILPFSAARDLIQTGDTALVSGRGLSSKAIATGSRGEHSHAGIVGWTQTNGHRHLELVEFKEWRGGRSVIFEHELQNKIWDIFRPKATVTEVFYENNQMTAHTIETRPADAFSQLKAWTGNEYGWGNIRYAALRHLPFIRLFFPAVTDDESISKYPPYCSQAIAMAWRETHSFNSPSGRRIYVDPVPWLADWLTEPSDLARSRLWSYAFSVVDDAMIPVLAQALQAAVPPVKRTPWSGVASLVGWLPAMMPKPG